MSPRAFPHRVASPILVGAVTMLVSLLAVFLAYNANEGLPFVPTYDLRAELPSGAKLAKGNEIRVGGFRVGTVSRIEPAYRRVGARRQAVAVVELKLDRSVEPLAEDSRLRVRPRSALGLRYIELTPGRSPRNLVAGETIPLGQTSESAELEDIFSTFTARTRVNLRGATEGMGDALAGRGTAINESIDALAPLLRHQTRVMRLLSDPRTRLRDFLPELEGAFGQLAPVARTASVLFTDVADTLAALDRDPAALRGTVERLPPTLAVATRSLRRSRPVLAGLTDVARRLQPTVDELPHTLPPLHRALSRGTPVLGRSVDLWERLAAVATELRDLLRNPSTLLSLRDLGTTLAVTRPLIEFVAPYQTVCNYAVYFITPLGEHGSSPGPGGTVARDMLKAFNRLQPNSPATMFTSRAWDLPPGRPAQDATFGGEPAGRVVEIPGNPAIDAQGNADCQMGQVGYPDARLLDAHHRRDRQGSDPGDPNDIVFGTLPDGTPAGWNARVQRGDYPLLSGGTYVARKLGIKNLRDVP